MKLVNFFHEASEIAVKTPFRLVGFLGEPLVVPQRATR
jgi:hypothetical protein